MDKNNNIHSNVIIENNNNNQLNNYNYVDVSETFYNQKPENFIPLNETYINKTNINKKLTTNIFNNKIIERTKEIFYSGDNISIVQNIQNELTESQISQIKNNEESKQFLIIENEHSSFSHVPFTGNLISVLNNEIKKTQQFSENNKKDKNQFNEKKVIFEDKREIIKQIRNEEKIENIQNNKNNQNQIQNEIIMKSKPFFLFLYPIFNSNNIIGALEDETTSRIEVDFDQAFNKQDIKLKEFPQGSAYCNTEKYLYISGGQENQKDIGKIFLRISINKNDIKVKMVKMPMMNFSHWNHSMISNESYIFVIGGYNSSKCEYFSLKNLKWEKMFDLNTGERQRSMLVIHRDYLYSFMGYSQYNILDSVERININGNLLSYKWENINIANEFNLNLKFYGSGIYENGNELFFIGGKYGKGDNESDYKTEIYNFSFDNMKFNNCEICFGGKLNFIENKFHKCSKDTFGNFIDLNDGSLATICISSLIK